MCKSVGIVEVPSLSAGSGGILDIDDDGLDDLSVQPMICVPAAFGLRPENGALIALLSAIDYRNVQVTDAAGASFSGTAACPEVDFNQPFLLELGGGVIYKAWLANNAVSGIRVVSEAIGPKVFGNGFE